ncbi:MAG: hypothetical protein B6I36_03680 [Desulfobacteraceae bacterium 4572_35.1]|nr:MAG: hypothetical protein B6I36_03680 [Desulfobacteraceae bacterium 4572_35.1]
MEGDTQPCKIAVVIPALGEGKQLWATLASLAANPIALLRQTTVVVVINSRKDSDPALVKQNYNDLTRLRDCHKRLDKFGQLRLAWIDATSPTLQLPIKKGGVGLARKIGCELIMTRLDQDGLLIQLDADTLVENNYLPAVSSTFANNNCAAAVIPFRHQRGIDSTQENAINQYELYLRAHLLGLSWAGSPYAYHSLGSTIVCNKQSYIKAGGMNCRRAGEDFYFLQQLAKTSGVGRVGGTVVYPAARTSQRTPFGTGQAILNMCNGDREQLFYAPQCYLILQQWLKLVTTNSELSSEEILEQSSIIDTALTQFLMQEKFPVIWQRLSRTHKNLNRRILAFHEWFDALKTTRCIHHLSSTSYPVATAEYHVPNLLIMTGIEAGNSVEQWLEVLIRHQNS